MKRRNILAIIAVSAMMMFAGCANDAAEVTTDEVQMETAAAEAESEEAEELEATAEPTTEPKKTEEPQKTEEPATKEVVEAEPTAEPEPTEETATYTYADTTATMYAKSAVNVRDLPSTDGNKVGALTTNQETTVTGKCNETGWYRISYNGTDAYVSNNYLSDTKVAVATAAPSTNTQVASASVQTTSTDTTTGPESQINSKTIEWAKGCGIYEPICINGKWYINSWTAEDELGGYVVDGVWYPTWDDMVNEVYDGDYERNGLGLTDEEIKRIEDYVNSLDDYEVTVVWEGGTN